LNFNVSRATNVSSWSCLEILTSRSRLGLVSAGEAYVSVSGGEHLGLELLRLVRRAQCPSLPTQVDINKCQVSHNTDPLTDKIGRIPVGWVWPMCTLVP